MIWYVIKKINQLKPFQLGCVFGYTKLLIDKNYQINLFLKSTYCMSIMIYK